MESLFGLEFKAVNEARATIDAVSEPLGCSLVVQRTLPHSIEAILTSNSSVNAVEIASISTTSGLRVLKVVDLYKPGTVMQPAYQRSLERLEEDKWVDEIDPEFEDEMDQAAQQEVKALAEDLAIASAADEDENEGCRQGFQIK